MNMSKRRFLVLILAVTMLLTTAAYANEEYIEGERLNLNTVTKHLTPKTLTLPEPPRIKLFSAGEKGYQEKIGALVLYLAFSDTPEAAYDGIGNEMHNLLNGETGSMRRLFSDVSGGKVTYTAQIPQLNNGALTIAKDTHPRSYYERYMQFLNPQGVQYDQDGSFNINEETHRLYNLIANALDTLPTDMLDANVLDGNSDGNIDNVIILFPDPVGDWSDMLWPMSFDLSVLRSSGEPYPLLKSGSGEALLSVKQVTFQNYAVNLPTLYHEICHSLGLKDMYNYLDSSKELGDAWSPMTSGTTYAMNAIERESLGWITPEIIVPEAEGHEYELKALAKGGNAYKIELDAQNSTQSLYLEYRKKDNSTEAEIPDSGLLVWRCDTTLKQLNGNAYGPPYYQYLYRPFGNEQATESTRNAAFSQNLGRSAVGDGTNTPLYIPIYSPEEVTETNPAHPNEAVFANHSGMYFVFRHQGDFDSGISIYDIQEIEDDKIRFKLKLAKPDSLVCEPVFSHTPGNYTENISLTLSSPDNAQIHYTLDGSQPTAQSPVYDTPINISGAVRIKAVCIKNGAASNISDAQYYCYSNDTSGNLPFYNGTGNNQLQLNVPYDVVYIRFKDLQDSSVSGTITVYDKKTRRGVNYNAKDIGGKTIRVTTTGTIGISANSQDAKFEVASYSGINEKVSSEYTRAAFFNNGNSLRITTMLRNNSKIPQNAKTIIALYDDDVLMQVKIIDEVLYNSMFQYLTGADFELIGNEKQIKIFVWDGTESIMAHMNDIVCNELIR